MWGRIRDEAHGLVAKLDGSAEVPKGPSSGYGTARITLNRKTGQACWTLTIQGIGKPLSAHVQKGSGSQSGPVVIPLGIVYASKGCVSVGPLPFRVDGLGRGFL